MGQAAKCGILLNQQISTVSKLPDVSNSTLYSNEIFLLYCAGVLTVNDSIGTFAPNSIITRVAEAAIISCIAIKGMRQYLGFEIFYKREATCMKKNKAFRLNSTRLLVVFLRSYV